MKVVFPMHDTETAHPAQANPWIAALLSLVVPGLDQLYLGRRLTALVLHLGWLGIMAVWVFWAMASFPATLATAGVAVAWLLIGTIHAAALGRQRPLRCVGIPGDLVEVRDRQLLVNGEPQVGAHLPRTPSVGRLDDPYHLDQAGPVFLQKGQLFCLGDNWDDSVDSRYFGPMPVTALRGKPLYRIRPSQRSRLGQPLG